MFKTIVDMENNKSFKLNILLKKTQEKKFIKS